MTLALATRGYLSCNRVTLVSAGPSVVAAVAPAPLVKSTTMATVAAPTIKGGKKVAPTVHGAASGVVVQPPGAPKIEGGKKVAPIIRKAKKE